MKNPAIQVDDGVSLYALRGIQRVDQSWFPSARMAAL